ncbi:MULTISPECIES: DUF883 family protein [unclassified Polynucleobacter]|jgi:ElaB/YqjD/DUF883 family membrane-anchored ribosome-binding protein|uniref:DUF883 family protein n=1 Tax=unclassified Polynucleobacter TaxID=2640945 RepID=UPI00092B01DA|nr:MULTISPECIES: DUF883 family protein [unclassified Polynucleobacter]MBU3562943.1 DUF883 domain-containing protein [Polynucleobacter sp. Tro8-14-1]OJI05759.1 hypothetical protein AOC28_02165 [Polynucleobacter sp. MWH-Adler-W8]
MTAKKLEHSDSHDAKQVGAESLIGEFKALMADAEALIKATEDHPGAAVTSIRNKALETIAGAKESLSGVEGKVLDKAKVVADGTDDFVHRNPWEAVGVAAGLGLLIGLFIGRR